MILGNLGEHVHALGQGSTVFIGLRNTSTAYTDIKSIRASDVFMIARVQLVSQNICENLSYVLLSLFNEPMGA